MMARLALLLLGCVLGRWGTASAASCSSCDECHALMRRPDAQDYFGGMSANPASASLLDRRLVCGLREEIAVLDSASNGENQRCERFCSDSCRPEPPRKQTGQEVPCVSRSKPAKLNLAQLSTAYALTGCPEPKPCICQCFCDPIMYGTPLPVPPTPFATGAPPVLSLLSKQTEMKEVRAVAEEPRPIVLGPMAPPLPPLPPPPDRSFCPKSAACNCFCPCRE